MSDVGDAAVFIVLIVSILVYNLFKLKAANDPKDELLKLKKLRDEGIISQDDFDTAKVKLLKRLTE